MSPNLISYKPKYHGESGLLNFRQIDKFALSGGWQNMKAATMFLLGNDIRAVLDLQFTPDDEITPRIAVKGILEGADIEYHHILFYDSEQNADIEGIFDEGYQILDAWDHKYNGPTDKILVKCGAGISRSVAMLLYYYCVTRRLTFSEAAEYIRSKRNPYDATPQFGIETSMQSFLKAQFPEPKKSAFGEKE